VTVEREHIPVMFLTTESAVTAIQAGWARLESLVPLKERKFYGAFYPAADEYRVCVALANGDDPNALGLETGALPGGRYVHVRLRGEPPAVYDRIGPAFDALAERHPGDGARPSIEFYRSRDVIDLFYPVSG
jgi:DNA gyrase inhibitor GyrI